MSELIENQQNYNPDDDDNALIPANQPPAELDQWTGGVDYTKQVAMLPERLEWDKRQGGWKCESFMADKITARLRYVTTLWAIWSERVGMPVDMIVGSRPVAGNYEMGLRLIFEIDEYYYYWDCFGLTFKSAQSAVRRAENSGGWFTFDGKKEINTQFGPFIIPTLEKIDEGKNGKR